MLSFHGIKVASVRYMRSANIRYGSVRCPMLLFAPQGQTTSVCPPSPLLLSTSSLTLPHPTNKSQWLWHVGQNELMYDQSYSDTLTPTCSSSGQQQWPGIFPEGGVSVHTCGFSDRRGQEGCGTVLGWCGQPSSRESFLQRESRALHPEQGLRWCQDVLFRVPQLQRNMGPHLYVASSYFLWRQLTHTGTKSHLALQLWFSM